MDVKKVQMKQIQWNFELMSGDLLPMRLKLDSMKPHIHPNMRAEYEKAVAGMRQLQAYLNLLAGFADPDVAPHLNTEHDGCVSPHGPNV